MSHVRNNKIVTPKDEWGTPSTIFDPLDDEFDFDMDAAASWHNKKVPYAFTKENSALENDWLVSGKRFYLNPPFSLIKEFLEKAYKESQRGALVVCLLPIDGSTGWWHDYVLKSSEIRFIRGRVRYIGYDEDGKQIANSPMFSSCVVIFSDGRSLIRSLIRRPSIGLSIEVKKHAIA